MIEVLPSPADNIVAIRLSGKLERADYEHVVPLLESKIKQHGKVKLYGEVEDLTMPTISALWQDFKFDVKHYRDFSHIAAVGEPDWLSAMTKLAAPFVPAEVRVYDVAEKNDAMNWLRS